MIVSTDVSLPLKPPQVPLLSYFISRNGKQCPDLLTLNGVNPACSLKPRELISKGPQSALSQ